MENPVNVRAGSTQSKALTFEIKANMKERLGELYSHELALTERLVAYEGMTARQREDANLKPSELRGDLAVVKGTIRFYELISSGHYIGFLHTKTSVLSPSEYDLWLKEHKIFK